MVMRARRRTNRLGLLSAGLVLAPVAANATADVSRVCASARHAILHYSEEAVEEVFSHASRVQVEAIDIKHRNNPDYEMPKYFQEDVEVLWHRAKNPPSG